MQIRIYSKYIEVLLKEDSPFLQKILLQARKYFSQIHKLSNTLLILDDKKKIKKQYFLNWLIHIQEVCDKDLHLELLNASHLPIRIKIVCHNCATYQINARVRVLSQNYIKITLSRNDLRARRYILKLFEGYVCDSLELLLDSSRVGFWEHFMDLIQQRVVGNLVLKFDFQRKSHLTQKEIELEEYYLILDSQAGDTLADIRKKYIALAKKYHPDNVFGADHQLVQSYQQKFIQVQNAFKSICASLC